MVEHLRTNNRADTYLPEVFRDEKGRVEGTNSPNGAKKERGAPSALSPAFCLEPELTLVHLHCKDSSFIEMQIPFQLPAHVCILRIAYSSTGMW